VPIGKAVDVFYAIHVVSVKLIERSRKISFLHLEEHMPLLCVTFILEKCKKMRLEVFMPVKRKYHVKQSSNPLFFSIHVLFALLYVTMLQSEDSCSLLVDASGLLRIDCFLLK